jgi:hypothetical protein
MRGSLKVELFVFRRHIYFSKLGHLAGYIGNKQGTGNGQDVFVLCYPTFADKAAGTSIDYLQNLGVPYIFGFELRPGDQGECMWIHFQKGNSTIVHFTKKGTLPV